MVRHAGLPSQPFEVYDKANLQPVEGLQPFSNANPLEMMKWTEENEKFQGEKGFVFMRRTPLASDCEYVYALSTEREDKHTSKILAIFRSCVWYSNRRFSPRRCIGDKAHVAGSQVSCLNSHVNFSKYHGCASKIDPAIPISIGQQFPNNLDQNLENLQE